VAGAVVAAVAGGAVVEVVAVEGVTAVVGLLVAL
jgi:hypothetical protein